MFKYERMANYAKQHQLQSIGTFADDKLFAMLTAEFLKHNLSGITPGQEAYAKSTEISTKLTGKARGNTTFLLIYGLCVCATIPQSKVVYFTDITSVGLEPKLTDFKSSFPHNVRYGFPHLELDFLHTQSFFGVERAFNGDLKPYKNNTLLLIDRHAQVEPTTSNFQILSTIKNFIVE